LARQPFLQALGRRTRGSSDALPSSLTVMQYAERALPALVATTDSG
jgi:hypothetical protein